MLCDHSWFFVYLPCDSCDSWISDDNSSWFCHSLPLTVCMITIIRGSVMVDYAQL